jgi:hypothetical protein
MSPVSRNVTRNRMPLPAPVDGPANRAVEPSENRSEIPIIANGSAGLEAVAVDSVAAIVDELEGLADQTGEARFRHAAALVRGDSGAGRPASDDTIALARVAALLGDSPGRSAWSACHSVARRMAPPLQVRAMAERLRRKFRKTAS